MFNHLPLPPPKEGAGGGVLPPLLPSHHIVRQHHPTGDRPSSFMFPPPKGLLPSRLRLLPFLYFFFVLHRCIQKFNRSKIQSRVCTGE